VSTRSVIMTQTDGAYKGIYCHHDGYPKGVGAMLLEHYNTAVKVRKLLALGALSILAPKLEPDPGRTHKFGDYQDDVVLAYHRDRGDDLWIVEGKTIKEVALEVDHQYCYVFKDGYWRCNGKDLEKILCNSK
jgi:hypothetical protein